MLLAQFHNEQTIQADECGHVHERWRAPRGAQFAQGLSFEYCVIFILNLIWRICRRKKRSLCSRTVREGSTSREHQGPSLVKARLVTSVTAYTAKWTVLPFSSCTCCPCCSLLTTPISFPAAYTYDAYVFVDDSRNEHPTTHPESSTGELRTLGFLTEHVQCTIDEGEKAKRQVKVQAGQR